MGLNVHGILETALYVADLDRSEAFYKKLFGFETKVADQRMRALRIDDNHFLLLFVVGGSTSGEDTPGGFIPPHDGHGDLHMAFRVREEDIPHWREHLAEYGVQIISTLSMNQGHSIYFHDPDKHVIELGTSGLWKVDD
jgi:catechol 2,3-dioxygenase-like lactoylglutathione lyase family enzyme